MYSTLVFKTSACAVNIYRFGYGFGQCMPTAARLPTNPTLSVGRVDLELLKGLDLRVRVLPGDDLAPALQQADLLAGAGEPGRGDPASVPRPDDDDGVVAFQGLDG